MNNHKYYIDATKVSLLYEKRERYKDGMTDR